MQGTQLQMCAGCISLFYEKPTGDDLDKVRSVSQNATEENPFEASMGIYVFKRDVLVSLGFCLCDLQHLDKMTWQMSREHVCLDWMFGALAELFLLHTKAPDSKTGHVLLRVPSPSKMCFWVPCQTLAMTLNQIQRMPAFGSADTTQQLTLGTYSYTCVKGFNLYGDTKLTFDKPCFFRVFTSYAFTTLHPCQAVVYRVC